MVVGSTVLQVVASPVHFVRLRETGEEVQKDRRDRFREDLVDRRVRDHESHFREGLADRRVPDQENSHREDNWGHCQTGSWGHLEGVHYHPWENQPP